MENKKLRSDLPFGSLSKVPDFLPPPDKLLVPEKSVKITLSIDQDSLMFFKKKAAKLGLRYQKMMREVIKVYANYYSSSI